MSNNIIVCGTDLGSSGRRAVDLAIALARRNGARLHLVHAIDEPALDEGDAITPANHPAIAALRARVEARRDLARERLEALAVVASLEVASKVTVHTGRPWRALLEVADAEDAELVVVGPHARRDGLLDRLGERLLGSTARNVVRHAHRPVLVAQFDSESVARVLEQVGRDEPLCVVVGADFRAGGASALRGAGHFGGVENDLVLVHALQDPFAPDDAPVDSDVLRDKWLADLRTRLQHVADGVPNATKLRVGHGDPARVVTDVAIEENAHFVSVGSHEGGVLSRILLGSTAERALLYSAVPVLVSPPEPPTPDAET